MHYMNNSTYDLDDFIFNNEQGIYVFKAGTELINGPGVLMVSSCTLQYFLNSADPVENDIYAQQILYYGNNTFKRTCYWEQTSSGVYRTEWGDWETYAPLSQMRKIGYTYTNLGYNASTLLNGTVNTSTTIYGNPLAAWVQLRVQSQTPYSSVNEIFVDGAFNGNASTFVVYARGSGFVNGHVLGVNVFWLY